jgi:hypothetical protein
MPYCFGTALALTLDYGMSMREYPFVNAVQFTLLATLQTV